MENRSVFFIIFVIIVSTVYFFMHLFVYKSITGNLQFSSQSKKILIVFFLFSGSSFIFVNILTRMLKLKLVILQYYANTWLGIVAIGVFVFFLAWIISIFFSQQNKLIYAVSIGLILMISAISLIRGIQFPTVKTFQIPIIKKTGNSNNNQ